MFCSWTFCSESWTSVYKLSASHTDRRCKRHSWGGSKNPRCYTVSNHDGAATSSFLTSRCKICFSWDLGNSVCDLQDTGQNDIKPRNGASICKGDTGIHAQCRPSIRINREAEILHGRWHKHRVQQPEKKRFSPCYMDASRYADLVPPRVPCLVKFVWHLFPGFGTGEKRRKMEEEKGIIIRFVIGHRLVHVWKKNVLCISSCQ